MKRSDFQRVIGFVCSSLDWIYECVKDRRTSMEDREVMRKDLTALVNFLSEAKQHNFVVNMLHKWEDIKNECI